MRFGRLLPALSVLVAAGALIVLTGTGAAAPQPGRAAPAASTANVSAPAALDSYLSSLGVNRASLVTQRGARNYAGPNCPGKGWTCTTSTRVLQIATFHGQNRVDCTRGATVTLSPQSCIIVQTGTNNWAKCFQRTNSSAANQHCSIKQDGRRNTAFVDQFARASGSDEQSATQTAEVEQTSTGSGGNASFVFQSVRQSTGGDGDDEVGDDEIEAAEHEEDDDDDEDDEPGPPVALQTQDAFQIARVTQTAAGSGNNFSRVHQSERMSAKGAIEQEQNTGFASGSADCAKAPGSPFAPNVCAEISQSSGAGRNDSRLKQSIKEFAKTHALDADQRQGNFNGGIAGTVHQDTVSGRSSSRADQDKLQRMSAPITSGSFQRQFDPMSCCGVVSQDGGTGNSEEIQQSSSQFASDPEASQQSLLTGSSRSPTGSCSVAQDADNNSDTGGASETQSPCLLLIVVTEIFSGGGGGD